MASPRKLLLLALAGVLVSVAVQAQRQTKAPDVAPDKGCQCPPQPDKQLDDEDTTEAVLVTTPAPRRFDRNKWNRVAIRAGLKRRPPGPFNNYKWNRTP